MSRPEDIEYWNAHRNTLDDWCGWTYEAAEPDEPVCPAGCPDSERITWNELTQPARRNA